MTAFCHSLLNWKPIYTFQVLTLLLLLSSSSLVLSLLLLLGHSGQWSIHKLERNRRRCRWSGKQTTAPIFYTIAASNTPPVISPHLAYPLRTQWFIRPKCISSSSLCQLLHVWLRSSSSTPVRVFHFQQLIATLSLGVQVNAVSHLLFLSIRRICPTHFHLLNLTSVLIVFNFFW